MSEKPLKILMAEDEADVLAVMSKAVARHGYAVVTAKDGEEAWQKIQAESPDVILLDINMPIKNGFEVLKLVREDRLTDKWQPVIIVSARSELNDIRNSYTLEADHYITKPCQMDDVLKAIKLMAALIPQHKKPSEMDD
ncbi:MAG: response regulator [Candidatus Omnitrophica bacterium]|nr:response regulator [Candidatus Omnitrophota bacterium]